MTAEQCRDWDEREQVQHAEQERVRAEEERDRLAAWEKKVIENRGGRGNGFSKLEGDSLDACPLRSQRVAFVAVGPDGPHMFANEVSTKRALLRSTFTILVAWPGEWSQHIFLLDEDDKRLILERI